MANFVVNPTLITSPINGRFVMWRLWIHSIALSSCHQIPVLSWSLYSRTPNPLFSFEVSIAIFTCPFTPLEALWDQTLISCRPQSNLCIFATDDLALKPVHCRSSNRSVMAGTNGQTVSLEENDFQDWNMEVHSEFFPIFWTRPFSMIPYNPQTWS